MRLTGITLKATAIALAPCVCSHPDVAGLRTGTTPYYSRSITYSLGMLTGESYSWRGKFGQIKYVYAGRIQKQIRVEDAVIHASKTWIARLTLLQEVP